MRKKIKIRSTIQEIQHVDITISKKKKKIQDKNLERK